MTEDLLELGPQSKGIMLSMLPPKWKDDVEAWIKQEIAAGRMIWIADEGASSCKA